jgi:hypothetical protein
MASVVNIQAIRNLLTPPSGAPASGGRRRTRRRRRSSNARESGSDAIDVLATVLDRVVEGSLELDAVLAAARSGRRHD